VLRITPRSPRKILRVILRNPRDIDEHPAQPVQL